jgi:hypothetical protein
MWNGPKFTLWKITFGREKQLSRINLAIFLVSAFGDLHHVTRQKLKSVTSLQNIPYLDLENYKNIEDFSSLGSKQRFLRLSSCTNVTDAHVSQYPLLACFALRWNCTNLYVLWKSLFGCISGQANNRSKTAGLAVYTR